MRNTKERKWESVCCAKQRRCPKSKGDDLFTVGPATNLVMLQAIPPSLTTPIRLSIRFPMNCETSSHATPKYINDLE